MGSPTGDRNGRPPLRVISAAWGNAYVDELLTYCLPALLAPGNLPALVPHFSVELVLLTETRQYDRIRGHPAYVAASAACNVRLISIDDLTTIPKAHYGMAISYTLFRGFQDLGAKMTDTWLLFINSDFILADGSYRNLVPHLLNRSNHLVYAPSYCALQEPVRPMLRAAQSGPGSPIAVPPRVMAEWILQHRHFTIRTKTVNQRLAGIDCHDQFYWAVDESTVLARQFPVALAAMKPERHLADIAAFWDYGVIADFCPSMRYVALSDSDDFLMLELRERERAAAELHFGWKDPRDIAAGLYNVITDYTREVGRAVFILHARDVPSGIDASRARLNEYVDEVLSCLPARLQSHHNHPQWKYHYPLFHTARNRYLAREVDPRRSADETTTLGSPAITETQREHVAAAAGGIAQAAGLSIKDALVDRVANVMIANVEYANAKEQLVAEIERTCRDAAERFVAVYRERSLLSEPSPEAVPRTTVPDALRESAHAFRNSTTNLSAQLCNVAGETEQEADPWFRVFEHADTDASNVEALVQYAFLPPPEAGAVRRLAHAVFGKRPHFHRWNMLHACTRLACDAAQAAAFGRRCLVIGRSDLQILQSLAQDPASLVFPIQASKLPNAIRASVAPGKMFGCCLVEGLLTDMWNFQRTVEEVRPLLTRGSKIVALFLNTGLVGLASRDADFIRSAFPVCGPMRIAFCGSEAAERAFNIRRDVEAWLRSRTRLPNTVAVAGAMLAAAPSAYVASREERWRSLDNSYRLDRTPTSVTIEIVVGEPEMAGLSR